MGFDPCSLLKRMCDACFMCTLDFNEVDCRSSCCERNDGDRISEERHGRERIEGRERRTAARERRAAEEEERDGEYDPDPVFMRDLPLRPRQRPLTLGASHLTSAMALTNDSRDRVRGRLGRGFTTVCGGGGELREVQRHSCEEESETSEEQVEISFHSFPAKRDPDGHGREVDCRSSAARHQREKHLRPVRRAAGETGEGTDTRRTKRRRG